MSYKALLCQNTYKYKISSSWHDAVEIVKQLKAKCVFKKIYTGVLLSLPSEHGP